MQQHELIRPNGQLVTATCTDTHLKHLIRNGYKLAEPEVVESPKKPGKEGRPANDADGAEPGG
jgi:hypothetical protein